jgi:fructokinase
LGVLTDCIEIDSEAPTGTVTVQVSPSGQPRYTIQENVAWDRLAGEANARRAIQEADAVCFGTLAQRSETSRKAIEMLVGLTRPDALRVFDVNLRQHYYSPERIESSLHKSNVLKVNDGELPEIAAFFGIGGNVTRQMEELANRFELRTVACTRGEDGSVLLSGGRWSEHPGIPAKVVDTVGAGDSFTAAMVLGLLAGWDLDLVNERANRVAAWVASHPGATPPFSNELRSMFAA